MPDVTQSTFVNEQQQVTKMDTSKQIRLAFQSTFASLLCAVLAGCGGASDGQDRQPFSGTVTVNGQPLKGGYLVFEPKEGQTTQSGGMIADGKFDVPERHGAIPGIYSVAIFSEGMAPTTDAEPGTPEYEAAMSKAIAAQPVIPEKYNVKTELTAEVVRGEANVFEFNLNTK